MKFQPLVLILVAFSGIAHAQTNPNLVSEIPACSKTVLNTAAAARNIPVETISAQLKVFSTEKTGEADTFVVKCVNAEEGSEVTAVVVSTEVGCFVRTFSVQ